MRDKQEPVPPQRSATIPSLLRSVIEAGPKTARELSTEVKISEKDVVAHLEHLERSLREEGARLIIEPAACLGCGFVFRKRERLGRPSRCPVCRGERLSSAKFSVEPMTRK